MIMAILILTAGLLILLWSADRFVAGAAATAGHFSMPPLLIGMIIVGFGTSAPEMLVSAVAALQDNPGIALGNAYGSNIANIALILGVTALVSPMAVNSNVLRRELPVLAFVTLLSIILLSDLHLGRADALVLILAFSLFIIWSLRYSMKVKDDPLANDMAMESPAGKMGLGKAVLLTVIGLVFLILSSRMLVYGAVEIARGLGVNDMIIGLSIVAVGTSLPELASTLAAARKNEHELALGNVIGSNLFNTLAVVGIAGSIKGFQVDRITLFRDIPVMTGLTLSLFVIAYGFRGRPGRINRFEGALLIMVYIVYLISLIAI